MGTYIKYLFYFLYLLFYFRQLGPYLATEQAKVHNYNRTSENLVTVVYATFKTHYYLCSNFKKYLYAVVTQILNTVV